MSTVCEQTVKALTDCTSPAINFSCSTQLSMKIVGILTFMNMIHFMLIGAEHEKRLTAGLGSFEPSLLAHAISTKISCSNIYGYMLAMEDNKHKSFIV